MSKKTNKKKSSIGTKKSGGSDNDWYTQGEAGFEKKAKLDIAAKLKKEKGAPRFYLKPDNEALLVFVDAPTFFILEHNLKIDGKWGNFVTCTKDFQPCPICESEGVQQRPVYTAYGTAIDTRSFEWGGKTVKNRKVLYPAKGSAIKMIEKYKNKYKTLTGLAFKISRTSENDPNCGRDFEYKGRVDISKKFGREAAKPHDYLKILAPPTEEELMALGIGDVSIIGSDQDIKKTGGDDISDLL